LYFFVVLPLNCVRLCGGLIRDELQADTLGFLLTRPLSRARLVVLKYLSQITWLQMLALVEGLLLFAAGGSRHVPSLGALLPLFLGAQFLAVFVWGALGAFLGQVTQRYMPLALVYGFIIELGIGRIPTNINTLSMMRHLKTILSRNPALQSLYDWPASSVPLSALALVVATALFLGLAALLFTVKEYHHTAEMQK
jgi:ABC-type transport system involved in multi-copper enzyme maturation permease subunit